LTIRSPIRALRHISSGCGATNCRPKIKRFAEAWAADPADTAEWQAATYLLTGCHETWRTLGQDVLEAVSLAPVFTELEHPSRGWSHSEHTILQWAAHFWDVELWSAKFPYMFDEPNFHRWITACHLYHRTAPAPPITNRAPR
jgi:hypothetical protein